MSDLLGKISVSVERHYSIEQVYELYSRLQSKNEDNGKSIATQQISFFLSFNWLSFWLGQLDSDNLPLLFTFEHQHTLIGFLFLGQTTGTFGTSLHLNQTGQKQFDQMWTEYNDIISLGYQRECRIALLEYLTKNFSNFKLIVMNTTNSDWLLNDENDSEWVLWSQDKVPGYLSLIDERYMPTVCSKNTRSQINRSKNYIEKKYGSISIHSIQRSEITDCLQGMAALHRQQWQEHVDGSGFDNPHFYAFHQQLLNKCLETEALVLKIDCGQKVMGYLYYLVQGTNVLFYLSAIDYFDSDNKFKPGLVMHHLAMQHLREMGYEEYDFLAGEARYKQSLSQNKYYQYNIHLYRNKWYYQLLRKAAEIKRRVSP